MTLQLTLPPKLEERLRLEAERQGQPTETVALGLLDQHLPPTQDDRRAAAVPCCTAGWKKTRPCPRKRRRRTRRC